MSKNTDTTPQDFCCAARSGFGRRAEPERSEGGWSEAERSGAKRRGRGLGQRNTKNKKTYQICVLFILLYFFSKNGCLRELMQQN